jgi:uncharacterized membrane protein YvbJ
MNENIENQTGVDKKILLCWKCGFPNRVGDRHCMFCKAPLNKKLNFISRIELYLAQRKWRKALSKRKAGIKGANRFIALAIGIILFLSGCYLFTKAVFTNSFTDWMISLLFLIYGIFSIRFFLSRK